MNKINYLKALKVPLILLFLHVILAYLISYITYRNVTEYEQVISSLGLAKLSLIPLMLFSYGILFYAGWITVNKFNGSIRNSIFIGLIIGCIEIILSIINIVLMYKTIEGYKIGLAPMEALGGNILTIAILTTIVAIPFTLAFDSVISGLGGLIAKKMKK